MGLDWNPANKPKKGCEQEFEKIVVKLNKGVFWGKKKLENRFQEISVPAFESLDAPVVGRDGEANTWLANKYKDLEEDEKPPFEEIIKKFSGYKVFELLTDCPGVPWYSNGGMGYVEAYSFRGEFLKECKFIIGKELLDQAYEFKNPQELKIFGNRLIKSSIQYSVEHKLTIPDKPIDDDTQPGFHLHVVKSAGEWALFWAGKGHGLEPYF